MKEEKISTEIFNELEELYKVLGDKNRLHILWILCSTELCVNEIATCIGMTKSATSHQLKKLKMHKLVKTRREGKKIYYSVTNEKIKFLLSPIDSLS